MEMIYSYLIHLSENMWSQPGLTLPVTRKSRYT